MSPRGLGDTWWALDVAAPALGLAALLQGPTPAGDGDTEATVTARATVSLVVFTRTPRATRRLGDAATLHCAFVVPTAPPGPFALEWRHQRAGAGRLLLAYEATTAGDTTAGDTGGDVPVGRARVARAGVELLLGRGPGDVTEVTLRRPALAPGHEGTYVCGVSVGQGRAQRELGLRLREPPKVTLSPTPLVVAPGWGAELLCDAEGYYPGEVTVTWHGGVGGDAAAFGDTWSSGPARGADGRLRRRSGARLRPARRGDHGAAYGCAVAHEALAAPQRVTRRLRVAGAESPSAEDTVGLFLVTFVLYGLLRWLAPQPHDKSQSEAEGDAEDPGK
ncbi:tapasin [Eudromia elegans]